MEQPAVSLSKGNKGQKEKGRSERKRNYYGGCHEKEGSGVGGR